MTDENARVPDCIYLQPDCCVDWGGEGRQWCEDDVWGDDCPDHSPAIEYTRKALAAQPRDDVRFKFGEAVWDALKADANDLRKQQRIVKAFDTALAPTTQGTDENAVTEYRVYSGSGHNGPKRFENLADAVADAKIKAAVPSYMGPPGTMTPVQLIKHTVITEEIRFRALAEGAGK